MAIILHYFVEFVLHRAPTLGKSWPRPCTQQGLIGLRDGTEQSAYVREEQDAFYLSVPVPECSHCGKVDSVSVGFVDRRVAGFSPRCAGVRQLS